MQDKISAFMDGELDSEDAAAVVEQFRETDESREQWAIYHLISDALGQSEVKPFDITRRVSARLAAEPDMQAVLAPRSPRKRKPVAYAAAASIAAVAVAGWMSLQTTQAPNPQQNLADNRPAPAGALPGAPVAVSVSASVPAQINDYLLAHREFSPSTAMHGVAPYMRTVAESRENLAR